MVRTRCAGTRVPSLVRALRFPSRELWPKEEKIKTLAFHLPLLDVRHTHPRPHTAWGRSSSPPDSPPRPVPAISSASGSSRWSNHRSLQAWRGPSPTQTPPVALTDGAFRPVAGAWCPLHASQLLPLPLSHQHWAKFGPRSFLALHASGLYGYGLGPDYFSLNCKKKVLYPLSSLRAPCPSSFLIT